MSDLKRINELLNNLPNSQPKWCFSEDWLDNLKKRCGKYYRLKKIRNEHIKQYQELIDDLNSYFINSTFSQSVSYNIIEDKVIETVAKVLNSSSNYDPLKGANEKTFLITIIRNLLTNEVKKKNKPTSIYGFENSVSVRPYQVVKPSLLNNILELDGQIGLCTFLKNVSIAKNINLAEFSNNQDITRLNLKMNGINRDIFYNDIGNKFDPNKFSFVPSYFKYKTICKTAERVVMHEARDLVEKSKNKFHQDVITPLRHANLHTKANKKLSNTPVLSAIALDINGNIIKTAYKGQCGLMKHHCEFTLFESVFEEEDWDRIKGGTVFVTLEPCHKRGSYYCDKSNKFKPKIPCAVRCLESGIAEIYIAHHDPDESVKGHGIETLKTGRYSFKKENGKLSSKGFPDFDSVEILMNYFEDKGYNKVIDNDEELAYQIGEPVLVNLFHTDIAIQIMKINKDFLGTKLKEAFINRDYF